MSDEHTYHFCIKSSPLPPGFWLSPQVKVWVGKITIIWRNLIHAKLCKWQKNPSMDNSLQHYIFMYVYIHCFNWIWRLEYLKTLEWFCFSLKYKGFLNSPNKKFVLSRSFLNFLRIFCRLKEQFLWVWENFAPPPRIRPSFFAPGQGIRQKKLPGWPGFARSKKFSRGLPSCCTQLELTET